MPRSLRGIGRFLRLRPVCALRRHPTTIKLTRHVAFLKSDRPRPDPEVLLSCPCGKRTAALT